MATETLLSPGVLLQETDRSFTLQGTDPSGMAIIGPTPRGPVEIPTNITNYNQFKEVYGTVLRSGSQAYELYTNLAVRNYFDNGGSSALVVRVAPSASSFSAASGSVVNSLGSISFAVNELKNSITTQPSGAVDTYAGVSSSAVTSTGTGTSVTASIVLDTETNVSTITVTGQNGTFAIGDVVTFPSQSLGGTAGSQQDLVVTLVKDDLANTASNAFEIKSLGQGEYLNSAGSETAGGILTNGNKDNIRWEITGINKKSGTFTLVVRRGDDKTSKPLILEQFTNLSLDPLNPNYIVKAIGDQNQTTNTVNGVTSVIINGEFPNKSKYVRISRVDTPTYRYLNAAGSPSTDANNVTFENLIPLAQSGALAGGVGNNFPPFAALYGSSSTATNIQGLVATDYTKAISILSNKEEFKFKTLIVPGLSQQNHSGTVDTIISNTEVRGDNLFVLDLVGYNQNVATVKEKAEELDTSFATSYYPWVQVASPELGKTCWAPPSTVIPGVYSQTDAIAAPWFAPAGLNRGGLRNVTKVETKLSKAQRDDLYVSKVNPLATFPGQGVVVFGQKTLQQASSALDRVNVRRLLLDVKDVINGFASNVVFEQNTEATRETFVKQVTPYLDSLVQRSGLYAFKVKMDGELNTSDVIDSNQLVGQVFLQPTKTAEFILLDFILTPTGTSFTD